MLPADPRSVRQARRWVRDGLESWGREDLVESAMLGVSELVTNAILHATPPIAVTLTGSPDRPRIEVIDHSMHPPRARTEAEAAQDGLSTIGRGLGIVALTSAAWGSDLAPGGKRVWFEPTRWLDHEADLQLTGEVFDLADLVGEGLVADTRTVEAGETVVIELLDMPAQMFAFLRRRFLELRRELDLLALANGADYPIATELAELANEVDIQRTQARGVERLDAAIEAGLDRVDLEYVVPVAAPASMAHLRAMLQRADQFCREEKLLSLAAGPLEKALRDWYLGEFVRQGDGHSPIPWPGPFEVDDPTGLGG